MNPKERVIGALTHQPIDHLPTQIKYTDAMGAAMAAHFKVPISDLPDFLGNHILRVNLYYPKKRSQDGTIAYDWWGVGFDTEQEGYYTAFNPLSDTKDLDDYAWPDPHDPDLLVEAEKAISADGGEHFVTPNFGWALFERAWSLRGFENLLLDLAIDLDFVAALMDRIVEIQLVLIERFLALGMDGGYFGDDYGAQDNLLFSPDLWRTLIKPRLARLFEPFHQAGLPIMMHSDGHIASILPDLVEIGLTTLNPVQPEVLDHAWLRKTFGQRLAYYGGISTQTVLPYGSPEDVKMTARKCVQTLAPDNTGLILAPSHRMMEDIPMENVAALLDMFADMNENGGA
jgi:uroporphyrinogen decarboxylase